MIWIIAVLFGGFILISINLNNITEAIEKGNSAQPYLEDIEGALISIAESLDEISKKVK